MINCLNKNMLASLSVHNKSYIIKSCRFYQKSHQHELLQCCHRDHCTLGDDLELSCLECKKSCCQKCLENKVCYECRKKYSCSSCSEENKKYLTFDERQYCIRCHQLLCQGCYEKYDLCPLCYKEVRIIFNRYLKRSHKRVEPMIMVE
jgi:hypothetical protein